jgi:molybdopterin-binding protein
MSDIPQFSQVVDPDVPILGPEPFFIRRIGIRMSLMPQIRIKDAASFLGVSDDTVRRWIDQGVVESSKDESGRAVVDGLALATLAREHAVLPDDPSGIGRSARNRFVGLVTNIVMDTVMAQVELQCGPHRVVSLMSSEAVRELGLELGSVAVAVVKATTVIVETPASST